MARYNGKDRQFKAVGSWMVARATCLTRKCLWILSEILRSALLQLWLAMRSFYDLTLAPKDATAQPPARRRKAELISRMKSPRLSEDFSCTKYTDLTISFPLDNCFILVTDVVGSTFLYDQDPIRMKAQMDVHDTVARDLVRKFSGHIVANEGDSFHIAFQHLLNAVSFAVNFSVQLEEHSVEFPVRIGINYGTMTVRKLYGYKCYGPPIDEILLILKHNQGGKICIKKSSMGKYNLNFISGLCTH